MLQASSMTPTNPSPYGRLVQLGFVVPDLGASVESWLARGIGPFFEMQHVALPKQTYRGAPTNIDMSVAIAYSGGVQMELIEQHDDAPSLYRDFLAQNPAGGLHHMAFMTPRYDEAVAAAQSSGQAVLQEWVNVLGGRFAYLEPRAGDGTYVELIEEQKMLVRLFAMMQSAAETWDGSAPRRPIGG
jgi:methylmalonyl-CoA/ethylmalonyl-CoA epimerase